LKFDARSITWDGGSVCNRQDTLATKMQICQQLAILGSGTAMLGFGTFLAQRDIRLESGMRAGADAPGHL